MCFVSCVCYAFVCVCLYVHLILSACKLPWIFHILLTFFVLSKAFYKFNVLTELRRNKNLAHRVSIRGPTKRSIAGKHHTIDVQFTLQIV